MNQGCLQIDQLDGRHDGSTDGEYPPYQAGFQLYQSGVQFGARNRFNGLRRFAAGCGDHFSLYPVQTGSFQFTDSGGRIEGGAHTRKIVHATEMKGRLSGGRICKHGKSLHCASDCFGSILMLLLNSHTYIRIGMNSDAVRYLNCDAAPKAVCA